MTVVVAYQPSANGRVTIHEAAKEASMRRTALSVVHVTEGVDVDMIEKQKGRLHDEIAKILDEVDLAGIEWTLNVTTGVEVAEALLDHVDGADVELLVIGARRRSRVGKLIMGSVTQSILLRAEPPVLVAKGSHRS